MKKVLLFSKKDCTPCKMVKQYLQDKQIEVEEIDIFKSEDLVSYYDIMSVPTVLYFDGESDTPRITSLGFDMQKLEQINEAINN